jgi:hypothetical protein
MPLLPIVLTLIVVMVLLWLVDTYIPGDPSIKRILKAVVIICTVIWLLQVFGVFDYLNLVRTPRLH